jgi:hypothetical protein
VVVVIDRNKDVVALGIGMPSFTKALQKAKGSLFPLANMIRYLQLSLVNQKKKGYNALADLGLSPDEFFDAQGNLIDLYTIYQKFAKAAVDLPSRIETPTFFKLINQIC